MNKGFAVVDVETTRLYPRSHRTAEIAVEHIDPDGTVGNRWESLVNPQRDLTLGSWETFSASARNPSAKGWPLL